MKKPIERGAMKGLFRLGCYDGFGRAGLSAVTALGTIRRVDHGYVVNEHQGLGRTFLYTFFTASTFFLFNDWDSHSFLQNIFSNDTCT
jgi:hypothetical protein